MSPRVLVLYHANCPDGFCAAWIAHRKFGDAADYLPVQYGQEPPDLAKQGGRDIFILDFSYKPPVLQALGQTNHWVTILDHHKTAQADLCTGYQEDDGFVRVAHAVTAKFDMNKSGGRLAWEFFFPGKAVPWLVDYTEDRDLWRWKLPASRELSAAIASYPKDFDLWDRWAGFTNAVEQLACELAGKSYAADFFGGLVKEGAAILRYQEQIVDSITANASEVEIDGHKVLSVNTSVLFSEVAGKLAEGRPFGVAWFQRQDGKRVNSLRSRDGGIDVSEVARRHGGGGHRNAAGFEV